MGSNKLVQTLVGHKYGIMSAIFSPDNQFLISVGYQHDGAIYIWDWRSGRKLGGVKISVKVHSICFDPLCRFFVTVGPKHVKFWDMTKLKAAGASLGAYSAVSIDGTSAVLGEHKNLVWVDVQCRLAERNGRTECYTYLVSENGLLVMLNESYVQLKWLNAKMDRCLSIASSEDYLFCGGSDGKIRIFEPVSLHYIGSLPLPDPMGQVSTESTEKTKEYPEVVTMRCTKDKKVIVLYSNRTICIFETEDYKRFRVLRNFKSHCDCIWGVVPISTETESSVQHSFITYSQDGTVRFWSSDGLEEGVSGDSIPSLQETLVADPIAESRFKNKETNESQSDLKTSSTKSGIRSFAVDPTGRMVACGDRNGTLRYPIG
jgi:WD40 repeat protein